MESQGEGKAVEERGEAGGECGEAGGESGETADRALNGAGHEAA